METPQLSELARELEDVERANRRAESLRDRLKGYEEERATIVAEQTAQQSELTSVRRGARGVWLWARGRRDERMEQLQSAIRRHEQRRSIKDRLSSETNAELSAAEHQLAASERLDVLRARFQDHTAARRKQLAPELAAALRAQELELGGANIARESSEIALRQVREIGRLLEAARVSMETALRRAGFYTTFLDGVLLARSKYAHVDAANRQLAAAERLMSSLRALDPVRDDLEPLGPEIGKPLRIADYLMDGMLIEITTSTRIENALEGVYEAQKLFADLERPIAHEARVARNHAENIERRFRQAVVTACEQRSPDLPSDV